MPSQSRQLAAIMFTDIVGYTALMGKDEAKALRVLQTNREIHKRIIRNHGGKWLKEMGDGTLCSFNSASDAVYCSGEIMQACKEADIELRIGIHTGDIVEENGDVFGDGVNVASRLESQAEAGCIYVSEPVYRNIKNKEGITYEFIEEKTLKNVDEPVRIYSLKVDPNLKTPVRKASKKIPNKIIWMTAVAAVVLLILYGLAGYFTGQSPVEKTIEEKTIAVLPFKDDSEEGDTQYFCDGMMDEILNHLQKISDLGVKSRTDVEKYRDNLPGIATIAEELDVAFVLEGAVRKYGDRFRVTTQLIDVTSGNHLWSETYDGTLSDTIFAVQTDIAKTVASALNAIIKPEEAEIINKIPTTSIDAYDLLIQAWYEVFEYWKDYEKERLVKSQRLLDQALNFDPLYIDAIAAKGTIFLYQQNSDSALVYAKRIIDLDPDSNRGYKLMGDIYKRLGNFNHAIEYYEKAVALPPKDREWLWCYMELASIYGYEKKDFRKAIANFKFYYEEAKKKKTVGVSMVYFRIAQVFFFNGAYDKAMHYYNKGFEMADFIDWYTWNYNTCLLLKGKISEAIHFIDSVCAQSTNTTVCNSLKIRISSLTGDFAEAERVYQLSKDLQLSRDVETYMVFAYSELGKQEEAAQLENEIIIRELKSKTKRHSLNLKLLYLSRLYAYRGDRDKSLEFLRETAKYDGFTLGWQDFILIDPMFESLRDDPEFLEIVKEAQEDKAAIRAQIEEMVENGELDWLEETL